MKNRFSNLILNRSVLGLLLLAGLYYLLEASTTAVREWSLWGLRFSILVALLGFYGIWLTSLVWYSGDFSPYIIRRSWTHLIVTILGILPATVQMLFIPMNWVNTFSELVLLVTIDLPVLFTCIWLLLFYLFIREGGDIVFYCIHKSNRVVKNKKLLYRIMAISAAVMVGAPIGLWGLMLFTLIFLN